MNIAEQRGGCRKQRPDTRRMTPVEKKGGLRHSLGTVFRMVRLLSVRRADHDHRRPVLRPVSARRAKSSPCSPSPPASSCARCGSSSSGASAISSATSTPSSSPSFYGAVDLPLVGLLPGSRTIGVTAPILLADIPPDAGDWRSAANTAARPLCRRTRAQRAARLRVPWLQTTATLGLLLSLLVILFFRSLLGEEDFAEYGWRFRSSFRSCCC